ncbi:hypothetical protein M0R45_038005 [Rubus argutus]|uniref:C2H2-type domain-containing protein n=1 Tax=Rubus argutus TaxID=59490 RepID=A0AAW1W0Z2_RUBAR
MGATLAPRLHTLVGFIAVSFSSSTSRLVLKTPKASYRHSLEKKLFHTPIQFTVRSDHCLQVTKMIYRCNECEFETNVKRLFENHMVNHDKRQAMQSLLNELPGHLSLNKNKQLKQFYCKQCDAGFVLENGLKDHLESTKHKSN